MEPIDTIIQRANRQKDAHISLQEFGEASVIRNSVKVALDASAFIERVGGQSC